MCTCLLTYLLPSLLFFPEKHPHTSPRDVVLLRRQPFTLWTTPSFGTKTCPLGTWEGGRHRLPVPGTTSNSPTSTSVPKVPSSTHSSCPRSPPPSSPRPPGSLLGLNYKCQIGPGPSDYHLTGPDRDPHHSKYPRALNNDNYCHCSVFVRVHSLQLLRPP